MGWEKRGGNRYYYRARKINGRVKKQYFGTGELAELCEQMDIADKRCADLARFEKSLAREEAQEKCAALLQLETLSRSDGDQIKAIVSAALTAAGYHRHKRGEWRKKRMGIDLSADAAAAPNETQNEIVKPAAKPAKAAPLVPGEPGYLIADKDARRAFIRRVTKDTLPTADGKPKGDKADEARALACLRAYPNESGNICGDGVERVLELVGFNPVHREIIRQQAGEKRRELAGPNPSPLEDLLIDRIVACWLTMGFYEEQQGLVLKKGTAPIPLCKFNQERVARAQKQYLAAIKTLAQVRRLQIPINVQVNVAAAGGQQVNVSGGLAVGQHPQ